MAGAEPEAGFAVQGVAARRELIAGPAACSRGGRRLHFHGITVRYTSEYARYDHPVGYSGTAADVWRTYAAARGGLADAYEAMKTQVDNQRRTGLGRIVDATRPAETAASNWDYVAEAFVDFTTWYASYVDSEGWSGTQSAIEKASKTLKLDVTGWKIAYELSDYRRDSMYAETACGEIATITDTGQRWLREVGQLAGDR